VALTIKGNKMNIEDIEECFERFKKSIRHNQKYDKVATRVADIEIQIELLVSEISELEK
jgi:hypothetical protein